MWNRLSVIFILLFAASIASAQLANFKGGLEAGVMGTQVDGDTLSGYDKAGLRVGGFIEKPVTEEISVQFAMVYTQKGSQGEKKVDDPFSFYEINLHYVDMPLTARYYHKSGVFGEGGLALGYLFKQKEEGNNLVGQFRVDESPGFNKFELSWHLGIGYKIFPYTSVHAQFAYSLLKIRGKYDSEIPGVYAGQYNNTLMVALQIYLGKRDKS